MQCITERVKQDMRLKCLARQQEQISRDQRNYKIKSRPCFSHSLTCRFSCTRKYPLNVQRTEQWAYVYKDLFHFSGRSIIFSEISVSFQYYHNSSSSIVCLGSRLVHVTQSLKASQAKETRIQNPFRSRVFAFHLLSCDSLILRPGTYNSCSLNILQINSCVPVIQHLTSCAHKSQLCSAHKLDAAAVCTGS